METNKIEIKDFVITWNGLSWLLYCKEPKVYEYIYLPITQIVKMLDIENISTEEFDRHIDNWDAVKFKKVVLLMEVYADGDVYHSKLYESEDSEVYAIDIIQTEIKA